MGGWSPATVLQEKVANRDAAGNGNVLVVNDTFKRQFQLSGGNIGDDRKGTVDETSKSD